MTRHINYLLLAIFIAGNGFNLQVFTHPSHAKGSDHVGNGGGLSEQNLHFAWLNMKGTLQSCKNQKYCPHLSSKAQELLYKLDESFAVELSNGGLVFVSPLTHPEELRRLPNPELRQSNTQSQIGSKIYLNIEKLFALNSDGSERPLNLSESNIILLRELAYHHSKTENSEELIELTNQIAKALQSQSTISIYRDYRAKGIVFEFVNLEPQQLRLSDSEKVIDIGQVSKALFSCEKNSLLSNIKFGRAEWQYPLRIDNGYGVLPLVLKVEWSCKASQSQHFKAELTVNVKILAPEERTRNTAKILEKDLELYLSNIETKE
jgi:hypothetical protein